MENTKTIILNLTPEFVGKVVQLQKKVCVNKGRENKFADFMYRSIDDIYAKTKPAAVELGLLLFLTDDVVMRGNRFYVEATAVLTDGKSTIRTTAYAREVEHKTKSDDAQVTGMASSYARKYCLDGLLQTGGSAKDIDGENIGEEDQPDKNKKPAPKERHDEKVSSEEPQENKFQVMKGVIRAASEKGYTSDDVKVLIEIHFNKYSSKDVTLEEAYLLQQHFEEWLAHDIPDKAKKSA